MIQKATLDFLKDLKKNNAKEWFDPNRAAYDEAKKDFLELIQQLINGISEFDKGVADAHLDPKKCIMRINRDVRFSKNKDPYKTNFFAFINEGGKKSNQAGYYFQLQPGSSFAGGGVYMPSNPDLNKFRQEIDYNFKEWEKIIEGEPFKKVFTSELETPASLVRTPKGFADDSPALEYLKMKGYYTKSDFSDAELKSSDFVAAALKSYRAVRPLVAFLNRAL